MKVRAERLEEYGKGDGRFCLVCVYWAQNLIDGGLCSPEAKGCGLGCSLGDSVCREMRTSNCSIKKHPPASMESPSVMRSFRDSSSG